MLCLTYTLLLACTLLHHNAHAQQERFKATNPVFSSEILVTNPNDLIAQAKSTLRYFRRNGKAATDPEINSQLFPSKKSYLRATKNTLASLISFLSRNKNRFTPYSLCKHFHFTRWNGYSKKTHQSKNAFGEAGIRLTKYLVFKFPGSTVKTKQFPYALYATPNDEAGHSEEYVKKNRNRFIRFRYTKHDILKGALEQNANRRFTRPLVWLSREGIEEAIMQGTIIVQLPGGVHRMFNVDKNNGIAYDKTLKNKQLQKRYWYFKETHHFQGYGTSFASRIHVIPYVAFAGDVKNIGLGVLVALRYTNPKTKKCEMRLGIIADKGGAFENNLCQLDYFVGAFSSRDTFKKSIQTLPTHTEAFILTKK